MVLNTATGGEKKKKVGWGYFVGRKYAAFLGFIDASVVNVVADLCAWLPLCASEMGKPWGQQVSDKITFSFGSFCVWLLSGSDAAYGV